MSDYPLKDLGAEFTEYDNERIGMLIPCPNCKVPGGVMFSATTYRQEYPGVTWERTGDTLETISLNPSVKMFGHFHSWVRNGMLCVDSPFECQKEPQ